MKKGFYWHGTQVSLLTWVGKEPAESESVSLSTVQTWRNGTEEGRELQQYARSREATAHVYASVPSLSCRWSSFVLCLCYLSSYWKAEQLSPSNEKHSVASKVSAHFELFPSGSANQNVENVTKPQRTRWGKQSCKSITVTSRQRSCNTTRVT